MPNKDGTGPQGKGPGTGRGAGNCSGSGQNSSLNLIKEGLQIAERLLGGRGNSTRGSGEGRGKNRK